ncbi:phage terminase large subunit [Chryseobacterium sp. EO14]|uniref:phage terminase large subunit n=1 Tax=Chryseobacterium sp. EO14 TaxID=2950551 RepID=UPI00210CD3ED|nr:phage terminase large subunit [Chryseobacterium sp. EO14]
MIPEIEIDSSAYSKHLEGILYSHDRYIIAFGGRGSGKTDTFYLKYLLELFQPYYFKLAYINKEKANIRDQQYAGFKRVAKRVGLYDFLHFYDGDYRIVNPANGNSLIPKGMDDPEKTKGLDDITAIWWDEINKGTKEDFTTLNKLLRSPVAKFLQFALSFNPVSEKHWLRSYFFDDKDWYKLNEYFSDKAYLNHSTFRNNEFIDQEQYYETLMADNYDQSSIDCDVNGLWGNPKKTNLFINTFNKDKHVPKIPHLFDKSLYTTISVDFNVSPMTAVVIQTDLHLRKVRIVDEFRDLNSDIYKLCKWIEDNYDTRSIFITGDSTGNNRHSYSKGGLSGYKIIQQQLKLNYTQMKAMEGKPQGYVQMKRLITNAFFSRHPDITISNAPYLVDDLESITLSYRGDMDKNEDPQKSHLLDCLCDGLFTIVKGNLKNIPT